MDLFKDVIKKHFPQFLSVLFLILYGTGFVIWNKYLSIFGFFEYNLIQVRYFSAGIVFWITFLMLISLVFGIIYVTNYLILKKLIIPNQVKTLFIIVILLFIHYLYLFDYIFQIVPQYWGGSKSIITTVIGTKEQINYLKNFGIDTFDNGKNGSIQTFPICLFYQNDRYALLGTTEIKLNPDSSLGVPERSTRVISISRENFNGFHSYQLEDGSIRCEYILASLGPKNIIRDFLLKKRRYFIDSENVLHPN